MKIAINLNKKEFFFLYWFYILVFVFICFLSFIERKFYLENFKYNKDQCLNNTTLEGKIIFIQSNLPNKNYILKTSSGKKVFLYTSKELPYELFYGEYVLLRCKIKNVSLRNSYSLYLYNVYGVEQIGYILDVIKNVKSASIIYKILNSTYYISLKIQNKIVEVLKNKLSSPYDTMFLKLTLGYNEEETKEIESYFQNAGVAHVLVVSGLHVGFVYLFVNFLLKFLPIGVYLRTTLSLLFIFLYMFLVGNTIPVIRATILIICLTFATILKRKTATFHSLVLAAIIIMILFPQSLFSPSFQLSFGACFGIFYFYRKIVELINLDSYPYILKSIISLFLVTLSAQLVVNPILVYYFNKLALVSFVSNIVIVPVTSIIVCLGFVYYLLVFVFQNLPVLLWNILETLLKIFLELVKFFAKMPGNLYLTTPSLIKIILYYFVILSLPYFLKNRKFKYYLFLVVLVFFGIILENFFSNKLKIYFFDVGLGDSILVATQKKNYVLIDAAKDEKIIKYNVAPLIYKFTNKIEHFIITHPHYPHYGGAKYIIENFNVKNLYISNYIPDWCNEYKEILELAKEKCVNIVEINSKHQIVFKDLVVDIIPNLKCEIENLNKEELADKYALTIFLKYKNYNVILPNDNFVEIVKDKLLYSLKEKGKFFVLQLPKHGKYPSEIFRFNNLIKNFDNIKCIGVVSSDKLNFDKNILPMSVLSTDECGSIEINFGYKNKMNIKMLGYKTILEI